MGQKHINIHDYTLDRNRGQPTQTSTLKEIGQIDYVLLLRKLRRFNYPQKPKPLSTISQRNNTIRYHLNRRNCNMQVGLGRN